MQQHSNEVLLPHPVASDATNTTVIFSSFLSHVFIQHFCFRIAPHALDSLPQHQHQQQRSMTLFQRAKENQARMRARELLMRRRRQDQSLRFKWDAELIECNLHSCPTR